jgi:hypothetical protein
MLSFLFLLFGLPFLVLFILGFMFYEVKQPDAASDRATPPSPPSAGKPPGQPSS